MTAESPRPDDSDGDARDLIAALDALLHPEPGSMLVASTAGQVCTWGEHEDDIRLVPDRQLLAALRERADVAVIVAHRLSMTLVRALQRNPVPLLVWTGEPDPSRDEALVGLDRQGVAVLGPRARLRYGEGPALLCAPEPGELEGLWRSQGGARLGVCPTPRWWWRLLDRAPDVPAAGYVRAQILDEDWARWAARCGPTRVLVPLGVPTPPIESPRDPALAAAVAAHGLERWTGPVFPSPRVIASVLKGLCGVESTPAQAPPDPGIWTQARRALPMTGAVVGMEQAREDLATDVATAAFLAQRALLRVDAATAAQELDLDEPVIDDDGPARAAEVLRSAGQTLTDHESKVVLRGFGMEVTRQAVASSASGAAGYADRIGFPVALKALSPDLRRRAEIGAVALSLKTAAAVRRSYAAVVDAVERHAPTARLDGVLVAEMVEPGLDLHCGAVALPQGSMAIYGRCVDASAPVEPVLATGPLSRDDALLLAHAVLSRMPVPALRRQSDPSVADLATILLRLSALLEQHKDRLEQVELRPVRLLPGGGESGRGYVVLDARIVQQPHLQGR